MNVDSMTMLTNRPRTNREKTAISIFVVGLGVFLVTAYYGETWIIALSTIVSGVSALFWAYERYQRSPNELNVRFFVAFLITSLVLVVWSLLDSDYVGATIFGWFTAWEITEITLRLRRKAGRA